MPDQNATGPTAWFPTSIASVVVAAAMTIGTNVGLGASAGETRESFSATDLTYVCYLNEIMNMSRQFGDSIWPGLDYNRIPMLLYRPDSVAFLFNHLNPPQGFRRADGIPCRFRDTVYMYRGRFEDYTGQFWPIGNVNGRVTFVCPYDDDEWLEERFFRFVAHEAFHTFQSYSFQELGDTDEKLYPITLADNNALATLENLVLAEAVSGLIADRREEVVRRAREFAIVREYRLRQAPPFVRQHEQIEERLENTAFYVEKRCEEAGSRPGYTSSRFREYTTFDPYLSPTKVLENLRAGILEHVKGGAITPMAMPRYRIYDNGASIGYILDYLGISWKNEVISDPGFVFHHRLMQGLGVNAEEEYLTKETETIKREFHFDEILSSSRKNVDDYHTETQALEAQIRASGNVAFRIVMNVKRGLSQSKRSTKRVLYANEGRVTLIENADRFLVKTAGGSVTIRDKGLIFSRSQDDDTATILLYDDQMPNVITTDGREQPLTDGVFPFHSSLVLQLGDILRIEGKSGEVTVRENLVEVRLE